MWWNVNGKASAALTRVNGPWSVIEIVRHRVRLEAITDAMQSMAWLDTSYINITVKDGVVRISGFVQSKDHQDAVRIMAKEVPGVERVETDLEVGMPTLTWDGQLVRGHMLS